VLEPDATGLLVELVGADIGTLVMEIEKLATYVGARKRIGREDVATMVDAGRIREIWDALNACTTGRGEDALITLGRLFAAKEAPQKMIAAMSSSLLKTHHAGVLRRAKIEAREACREAGIPPFAVESTLKQHAHLGPSRVDKLPELLLRTD